MDSSKAEDETAIESRRKDLKGLSKGALSEVDFDEASSDK